MSDNRKYYYLKLKENFYNSETMVILESMQDGLLYSNLLLKMYLMSLKSGGILMLNDHLPHTPQTIATFTRHQAGTVERALKVFLEFGLVEILTDGAYYMADIQLLIGQSSTEGERKKKERMRLKRQKLLPSGGADICPPYSQGDICPPEIKDKRLDIRDKSIENRESESARCKKMLTSASLPSNSRPGIHCSSGTIDSSRPMRTRPDNRISSRVAVLMILLRNSARLWLSTRELDMGRDLSFKFDRKAFTTV